MENQYLVKAIDTLDEGIVVIDNKGIIRVYNNKAKNIFGINPFNCYSHKEGKAEKGDVIIIADNTLGEDDGKLEPKDLANIGLNPDEVNRGDGIVAIGRLMDNSEKTKCKILKKDYKSGVLNINKKINNVYLESIVDYNTNSLKIKVNDKIFAFKYHRSAGHIVVLDKADLSLKFYQSLGYTARREDIKSILQCKEYEGKGKYARDHIVLNKYIKKIHPTSPIIDELIKVAQGLGKEIENKEVEVNGIPVRSSISSLKNHQGYTNIGSVLKIIDISEIKTLVEERDKALDSLNTLEKKLESLTFQNEEFNTIIGESKRIKEAIKIADKASRSKSTVLLLGESGTGKGLFAEAIHKASSRKNMPYVYLNCASIPSQLLESELFGYEKGAFTGASEKGKPGKFEIADGGTLFLDEIGEMPMTMQVKLLHFLQKKAFTRVGGIKEQKVDVRIIAATNKNLDKAIVDKEFREDLYYRINVISLHVPSLRERKEDIYPLVNFMLPKICENLDKERKKVSDQVMKLFMKYPWYGNVRELENVLERAVNLCEGSTILSTHLPDELLDTSFLPDKEKEDLIVTKLTSLENLKKEVEIKAIKKALKTTNGNRKEARTILNIGKTSFYDKLKKYNLE